MLFDLFAFSEECKPLFTLLSWIYEFSMTIAISLAFAIVAPARIPPILMSIDSITLSKVYKPHVALLSRIYKFSSSFATEYGVHDRHLISEFGDMVVNRLHSVMEGVEAVFPLFS